MLKDTHGSFARLGTADLSSNQISPDGLVQWVPSLYSRGVESSCGAPWVSGWMNACPVMDSTRWQQLLRTSCRWWEQQTPGMLPTAVLSPLSAQIVGVCGLPWAGQLHSHSETLLYYKKPAGELQMVSTLIKSFVQHKRGGTGQEICPAAFGT